MADRRIIPLLEDIPGMSHIPTDIIFDIPPLTVKLNTDLPRFRKDMGDVRELAESIKTKGQIHPILIDRNNKLVCGGRRLAACIFAGINVKAAYTDQIDPTILRELELEENLRRKNFSPGEEVMAIQELHELKCKQFGNAVSGRAGGWKIEDTALLLGKSKSSVIGDIQLAAAVRAFPELARVANKNMITKAIKGLDRITTAIAGISKHEEAVKAKEEIVKLYFGDSIPFMRGLEDKSIDILFTDPMYGIDADKTATGVGGITGGVTSAGFNISDEKDSAFEFIRILAVESFRFTTDKAHGYVFVGPEHFYPVRVLFTEAGWFAYIKPMLWIKRESGQTNVPYAWPASCYETFIYIRKQESRLVKEGMPDWIECPPVNISGKIHPYEKPLGLLTNLLERICFPGNKLYDPCMGSGAIIEAGIKQKLFCIGGDNNQEAYSGALSRLAKII